MTTQQQQDEELVKRATSMRLYGPAAAVVDELAATITRLMEDVKQLGFLNSFQSDRIIKLSLEVASIRQQLNEALAANGMMREALERLMTWQVKNVDKWHNSAYDHADDVLKQNLSPTALADHDAEVRRKALEDVIALWDAPYKQGFGTFIEQLRRMAAEKGAV